MADDKPNDKDKPKIIVDDDWKAQARVEKEKLAKESKQKQTAGPEEQRELPPASFETLLSSMATQAMFVLGMIPDPRSGQRYVDLDLAKHHIDSLAVLDEKTKGNLDPQEKMMLDQTLHELRMHYVQLSQAGISRGVLGNPPESPAADAQ